jgi:hypothetical protein
VLKRVYSSLAALTLAAFIFAPTVSHAQTVVVPDKGENTLSQEDVSPPSNPNEGVTVKITHSLTPTIPSLKSNSEKVGILPLISDPDGWQSRGLYYGVAYTGNDTFVYTPDEDGVNWRSAGGNFLLEFREVNNSFVEQLLEYDGIGNKDEQVKTPYRIDAYPNGYTQITYNNIGGFVDGSNNEAEFYIASYDAGPGQASFGVEGFD